MELLIFLSLSILCYLSGSLVWAKIITKLYKKDISNFGTGNPGTANFVREFGASGGTSVFIGDLFTSFSAFTFCLIVVKQLTHYAVAYQIITACLILTGTFFPLFFKFKGGTGLAKLIGISCAINPLGFLLIFPFILIAYYKILNFAISGTLCVILVILSSTILNYEYHIFSSHYDYPDMNGFYTLITCGLLVFIKGIHQYNWRLFDN